MLLPKPDSCRDCPLYGSGMGFSQLEGSGANGVLVVAEALGEHEERDGLPLRPFADAGSVFQEAVRLVGADRQGFTITNVCRCRPPHNELDGAPYEQAAIGCCQQYLDEAVRLAKPRCILALGGIPMRVLTGLTGPKLSVTQIRGYILESPRYHVPVVATYHPSFIKRGAPALTPVFMRDMRTALRVARDGVPPVVRNYVEYPTEREAHDYMKRVLATPDGLLSYDIETVDVVGEEEEDLEFGADKHITQIQFSLAKTEGISFPAIEPYVTCARQIMQAPIHKFGYNCFHKHTSVWMADGTWRPIASVAPGDFVRSVDGDQIVCRRVLNFIRTQDERPWIEVCVDGAYNRGVGRWGTRGVICTEDHKWILATGAKRAARDLVVGDEVVLPRHGSSDIIHGTLLGDGYTQNGSLVVGHTNKAWAEAKVASFDTNLHSHAIKAGYKPGSVMWGFQTPISHYWREIGYSGKQKVWSTPTNASLAVFYGDDGFVQRKGNGRLTARFALHKFTKADCKKVREWFTSEFGSAALYAHRGGFVLGLHVESSARFFERVAPLLHPSMAYKLPPDLQGQYNGWMAQSIPQIGMVLGTRQYKSDRKTHRIKHCLEIEGTHTFFTRGGLVSNCHEFDDPVLRANGYPIAGPTEDLRWMFHHMHPDIPGKSHKGGLQWVGAFACPEFGPWKHLFGVNLAWYGAADVDMPHRIREWLVRDMKQAGVWESYQKFVVRLRPILDRMSERGIALDLAGRSVFYDEIRAIQAGALGELQELVPDSEKNCEPKNGYASDKVADKWRATSVLEDGERWVRRTFSVMPPKKRARKGDPVEVELVSSTPIEVERWVRLQPFKPSSQQLKAYMRHRGHKIPHIPGSDTETANKLGLQRLYAKTRDPLYPKVLEYLEAQKIASTYIDGWEPRADGKIHTTFTFRPATGQLSSMRPNVQNTPKRVNLAKPFRKMIIASPGCKLVAFDYKSFHALTLGFEAKDPDYLRAARTDIHSIVCATQLLNVEKFDVLWALPDDELMTRLDWWKANTERTWPTSDGPKPFKYIRDYRAKPAILGYGFGLQGKHLYEANVESFDSQRQAQQALDAIDGAFPRTKQFRFDIRQLAQQRKFLMSRFGCIRWLWAVMTWDSKSRSYKSGPDAQKAIAFLPANDAFCTIKEAMIRVDDNGWAELYCMNNNVHDELVFDCPNGLVEECVARVRPDMSKPSTVLVDPQVAPNGLACAVSVSVGPNLGEMQEVEG